MSSAYGRVRERADLFEHRAERLTVLQVLTDASGVFFEGKAVASACAGRPLAESW